MPGMFKYLRRKSGAAGGGSQTAKDVYWNLVALLLRNQSSVQTKKFADASASNLAVTSNGDVRSSFFSPFSNVGFSTYFTNSPNSYLTIADTEALNLGANDFTIEAFVNASAWNPGYNSIFGQWSGSPSYLFVATASVCRFYYTTNGSTTVQLDFTVNLAVNTWYHMAMVRSGSTLKLYVDGKVVGSNSISGTLFNTTANYTIGCQSDYNSVTTHIGYISNLRVVKGTAVYTSNFAVPTEKLTAIAGTQLLACQSGSFVDNSANNLQLVVGGSPKTEAFSPFAPATYSQATHGTSVYFDGTGDYFTLPADVDMALGLNAAPFSFEFWAYPLNSGNNTVFSRGGGAGSWSTSNGLAYNIQVSTGDWAFQHNAGGGYPTCRAVGAFKQNVWQHLRVTFDGTTTRLFVNGVLGASETNATYTQPTTNDRVVVGICADYTGAFNGYVADFRVVNGTCLSTANFTVPTAPLAVTSSIPDNVLADYSLVLDGESLNDATGKNSVTISGNVNASVTQHKYGSSSLYFDGSGDELVVPATAGLEFGTGDFTIEFWMYATGFNNYPCLFNIGDAYGGSNYMCMQQTSANAGKFNVTNLGLLDSGAASLNTWTHYAICRKGSTARMFRDGVQVASSTNALEVGRSSVPTRIGHSHSGGYYFQGYIDDFRIIKGVCRYTSNFTPVALGDFVTNPTKFLLKTNPTALSSTSGFIDNSNYKHDVVAFGNTAQCKFAPFDGIGSAYFDGTGDYLSSDGSSDFAFGTGDFTIEMWFYATVASAQGTLYDSRPTGTNGLYAFIDMYTSKVRFWNSAGSNIIVGTTTLVSSTWYHLAVSRSGTSTRLFLNGVQEGNTLTDAASYINGTNRPCIGIDGNNSSSPFNGYISNVNVIKGTAKYSSNFAVPKVAAAAHANTKLLLNFTNSSATDLSGKGGVSLYADAAVNTTTSKFGSSLYFDGTGDYSRVVSQDVKIDRDFTVEFWLNMVNFSLPENSVLNIGSSAAGRLQFWFDPSGQLQFGVYGTGTYQLAPAITANTWNHFAIVRSNGTVRCFVNGVKTTYSATYTGVAGNGFVYLGSNDTGAGQYATCYLEELRITRAARYFSDFTAPTAVYETAQETTGGDPYYNNVVLHLDMNGVDNSTNVSDQKGKALTNTNVGMKTSLSKFGGSSAYFDGSSSRLVFADTSLFDAMDSSTYDATIECWIYPLSYSNEEVYFQRCIWSKGEVYGGSFLKQDGSICYYTGSTHNYVTTPANAAPLNTWTHVATVLKGNTAKIFINGVLSVSAARVNTTGVNQPFKIGVSYTGRAASFFHGYMDDFRVTRDVARYSSTFTLPTVPHPTYQDFSADSYLNQSILLKNRSAVLPQHTVFIDSSSKNVAVTKAGDVVQSGFGPFAGAGSAYFDGTGDYLTMPNTNFQLGTGDFTIEMWFYRNSGTGAQSHLIDFRNSGGLFAIEIKSTSTINLACGDGNNNVVGSRTINLNTWYHLAVTRASGQLKMFIDGVQDGSTYADGGSYNAGANRPVIGAYGDSLGSYLFNGSISNLRIVKGTAVYTSNFQVPTAQLTEVSGTSVLLKMDGATRTVPAFNNNAIIDSSTLSNPITRFGNVAQGTFSPFEPNYDANKYSWDFSNASGAHFAIGSNSAFALGTGDFTMETWMYWDAVPTNSIAVFGGIGEPNAEQLSFWRNGDGSFSVRINQGDYLHTTIPNCEGNWHHLAVTRQSGTVRLFIDGNMTGSMTNNYNMGQATFFLGSIHWAPTLRILGKLSNFRIVKGTAVYTSGFNPSRKPLTAIAGTLVLTCQDSTFKDNSANNWTLSKVGTVAVSTNSPLGVPYNAVTHGGSAFFDGSTDYLLCPSDGTANSPYSFGTGDFTIECWIRQTTAGYGIFYSTEDNGGGTQDINIAVYNNVLSLTGVTTLATTTPIQTNTWYHFAVTRTGGTLRAFVNGKLEASAANSVNYICKPNRPCIGMYGYSLGSNYYPFIGYISGLHLVKGTAKYTSAFTVPTAPAALHANTKLLLNFTNAAIVDAAGKICGETSSAGAVVDSANKKFATSMSFNGVDGTYLRLSNTPMFNFGTADYTIEFWYNKRAQQSNYPCLFYSHWPDARGITLIDQGGSLILYAGGGWGIANNFACGTLTLNSWTHIAVTRSAGVTRVFLNGSQSATHSNGGDMGWSESDKPCIGGLFDSMRPLNGCIEDFRVTKGIARYIGTFVPPLMSLPAA